MAYITDITYIAYVTNALFKIYFTHIVHITKLNFISIYLGGNINEWNCILHFDLCDKSYILCDFCVISALHSKIV